MEALQFKTVNDLLAADMERVELMNDEIIKRPMARLGYFTRRQDADCLPIGG